jgi:hypothetical protein
MMMDDKQTNDELIRRVCELEQAFALSTETMDRLRTLLIPYHEGWGGRVIDGVEGYVASLVQEVERQTRRALAAEAKFDALARLDETGRLAVSVARIAELEAEVSQLKEVQHS